MSQESRALRDSTAICHRPAGGTGHLDLQVNSSNVKSSGVVLRHFNLLQSNMLPHLYQLICFPAVGILEMVRGSTRHAMSSRLSQRSASHYRDVGESLPLWTKLYSLERDKVFAVECLVTQFMSHVMF